MIEALAVVAGLIVLVGGGELLVRGASSLALGWGLSPMVVGLTVVAFGTSSPELAVSVGATLGGSPDVAVGNVVGSNIYNILLILGVAALIRPLIVRQQLVRFDVPLVIAASVLLWVLALDGAIGRMEGLVMVALLTAYLVVSLTVGRREAVAVEREYEAEMAGHERPSRLRSGALFVAGLVAIVVGAQLLVAGASSIASSLGVPELVVGLTVVAIGTSLPELATSAIASLRGHRDIAVGNVMGSNLFNILGILGLTAVVAADGVSVAPQVVDFDLPVMTIVAVACLPLLFTGSILRRWEGALFVAYAVVYTTYVVLDAVDHAFADQLGAFVLVLALPATVVLFIVVLVRDIGSRRSGAGASAGQDAGRG